MKVFKNRKELLNEALTSAILDFPQPSQAGAQRRQVNQTFDYGTQPMQYSSDYNH
jgi:hypothetical protein